ncbi:MAG: TonB-dependent receptor [Salinivirgaceae bacterium]|nr:TonB-dependent receptor [Salinivirgaceae bacterium]
MKNHYFPIAIGLFLWIQQVVTAQEITKSVTDTIDIEEVVITGTKASINRNQVPYTLSVVKNDEIANSSESSVLSVLSQQVPGLFVTERGISGFGVANGSAGQISIRGIGASPTTQVLVLLNGNPQYMGIMGHPLADAYRSANIERVEVIRGPASALYGSNAMGGVINIITKEQVRQGKSVHLQQEYGSYNTLKMASGIGFKSGGFEIFTGVNYDQTDGHREASYFNILDGYIKTGYRFNEHLKATVDFSLAKFKGGDPGSDTLDIIKLGDTLDILRGMGAVVLNNQFDKTDGSFRFFYNFGTHDITSGYFSKDYNMGIMVYQNMELFKGNMVTVGVDVKTYGGKAENLKYHSLIKDTLMSEAGAYVSIQQQVFQKLVFNGSLRLENHTVFGQVWIPSVGMTYQILENSTLKASYSKGYRSPTIRELFIKSFPPLPNDQLKPEYLNSAECGVEQYFMNRKFRMEVTAFWMESSQLIQPVINEMGAKQFQNTSGGRNVGIELSLNHRIKETLYWNANYTYIDMEKAVVGTPIHKLGATIAYNPGKWNANLTFQQISDLYLNLGNRVLKESYQLLNAKIGYQFLESTNLYIKAENLLNQSYTINYGYPMPGITFMGGLSFSL